MTEWYVIEVLGKMGLAVGEMLDYLRAREDDPGLAEARRCLLEASDALERLCLVEGLSCTRFQQPAGGVEG